MRKLMWFAIGFVCACLLAVYLLPEGWLGWILLSAAVLTAAAFVVLRLRRKSKKENPYKPRAGNAGPRMRILRAAALGLAIGLLWCRGYEALKLAPSRALEGEYDSLSAEACDYPVETWYGQRVDAFVEFDSGRVPVRFYLYGSPVELRPGDRFSGNFKLRRSDRNADGDAYYDLQAKGILLSGSGVADKTADGGAPFRYFPARWSKAVFDRLGELLPADAAGLPRAMLTGNRTGLSEAIREKLSSAGASHVVAVSGLHVAMLMGVLFLLLGRSRVSSLLGLGVLLLFVLMTGASPSVVRAALMLGLLLLAPFFREENDPPTSLALAALLILLANPWAVANLSFQLSFGAVAGLLLASKPLQDYFLGLRPVKGLLEWNGLKSWPRFLRSLLLRGLRGLLRFLCGSVSASMGALLFTTPIAALNFGELPVYGVLTNLAVIPLATLCLVGALIVLVLGLISTTLGGWAGWLLAWPVRAVYGICGLVSRLPGATLCMDGYGLAFLLFGAILLILTLVLREKKYGRPLLSLLAALLVAVGLQSIEAASAEFSFTVLDVGNGQCVCTVAKDFSAVTDCGGSGGPSVGVTAAECLRRKGADHVDALILTHYDTDHVSGVETLLELMPVSRVYLPEVPFDPENRAAVEAAALAAGAELRYVTENLTLSFSGGTARIFAPVSGRNDNAACVSVLYSAGEYDMLVTGDLDIGAEYTLLERESLPPVELYVAGHHGSARSSSEELLQAICPDTVFISVGRNSYGLPSGETLARLEAVGAQIYRTDECGNLEITAH